MAERRTLGDALTMSPEKLAFIHGDDKKAAAAPAPSPSTVSKTVEVSLATEPEKAQSGTRRRRSSEEGSDLPNANEVLDEVLMPLTTRLPHRLIQSLRRLCLEQQLRHAQPDSIQKIIETALEEWLTKRRSK